MANFCTQCGKEVNAGDNFCLACGNPLKESTTPASPINQSHFDEKHARVMGKESRSTGNRKIIYIFGVAAVVLALLTIINTNSSTANPIVEEQPVVTDPAQYPEYPTEMNPVEVKVENGKIIVPVSLVKEKQFVSFNYNSSRGVIPMLAYVTGEGKIVTAVSMCEPCQSTTFHIRSDELVCNSCGTTWELDNLSGISGACQGYPPDAVPNVIVGDEIHIQEAIVAAWVPRA